MFLIPYLITSESSLDFFLPVTPSYLLAHNLHPSFLSSITFLPSLLYLLLDPLVTKPITDPSLINLSNLSPS